MDNNNNNNDDNNENLNEWFSNEYFIGQFLYIMILVYVSNESIISLTIGGKKKKKKPRLKSNGNKTPHSQTNPGIE